MKGAQHVPYQKYILSHKGIVCNLSQCIIKGRIHSISNYWYVKIVDRKQGDTDNQADSRGANANERRIQRCAFGDPFFER